MPISLCYSSSGRYQRLGAGSLLISNVSNRDQGKYTCRGDNLVDAVDAEVSITVLGECRVIV